MRLLKNALVALSPRGQQKTIRLLTRITSWLAPTRRPRRFQGYRVPIRRPNNSPHCMVQAMNSVPPCRLPLVLGTLGTHVGVPQPSNFGDHSRRSQGRIFPSYINSLRSEMRQACRTSGRGISTLLRTVVCKTVLAQKSSGSGKKMINSWKRLSATRTLVWSVLGAEPNISCMILLHASLSMMRTMLLGRHFSQTYDKEVLLGGVSVLPKMHW